MGQGWREGRPRFPAWGLLRSSVPNGCVMTPPPPPPLLSPPLPNAACLWRIRLLRSFRREAAPRWGGGSEGEGVGGGGAAREGRDHYHHRRRPSRDLRLPPRPARHALGPAFVWRRAMMVSWLPAPLAAAAGTAPRWAGGRRKRRREPGGEGGQGESRDKWRPLCL